MDVKTFESLINGFGQAQREDYEDKWDACFYELGLVVVDDVTIEVVETAGGMDRGSYAQIVFKVTDVDGTITFFRKNGYYASFVGFEWDGDLYEVIPKEKVVTVYEDARTRVNAFGSDVPDFY